MPGAPRAKLIRPGRRRPCCFGSGTAASITGGISSAPSSAKYVVVSRVGTTGRSISAPARRSRAHAPAVTTQARATISPASVEMRTGANPEPTSIAVTRRLARTSAPASTAALKQAAYARSASVIPPSGWKSATSSGAAVIAQRSITSVPVRSSCPTPHDASARAFSTATDPKSSPPVGRISCPPHSSSSSRQA